MAGVDPPAVTVDVQLVDGDSDTVADGQDSCPLEPEDIDEFEDTDGCPDPDNDSDYILDDQDDCPMDPEVYNGKEDEDGCPDACILVVYTNSWKGLLFEKDSAAITKSLSTSLSNILSWMTGPAAAKKVLIQGHTSTQESGKDEGQTLSLARARAVVDHLAAQGMDANVFLAAGLGTSCSAVGEAGSVDIIILQRDGWCTGEQFGCADAIADGLVSEEALQYKFGSEFCAQIMFPESDDTQ